MAITLSTGSIFAIAQTYGPVVTMSALTNATEAVATLGASHGVVVGDYLEVTSGWGKLDKKIVRAKTVVTNDVTFEGINTVSTTNYPAASGTGSIRRIPAWSNLSQVKNIVSGGGEQQYTDVTSLEDTVERKVPTLRSAVTMDFEVFDDPALAWYGFVTTASDSSVPYAMRLTTPNGAKLVANAYWSLLKTPMVTKNEALSTKISLSYAAEPVRYAT